MLVDPETGAETPFAAKNGTLCGFTRDGSRLLVQSGMLLPDGYALYRADGTAAGRASRGRSAGQDCMSLSPDGRYGVVARYESQPAAASTSSSGTCRRAPKRNLTNGQFGGYNTYPTWSPTGDWIVWASNKDRGGSTGFSSTDIWKIRPDGTGARKIMDGAAGRPAASSARTCSRAAASPADPEPTLEERLPAAAVDDAAGVEGTPVDARRERVEAGRRRRGDRRPTPGTSTATASYTDADGRQRRRRAFPDEGTLPGERARDRRQGPHRDGHRRA